MVYDLLVLEEGQEKLVSVLTDGSVFGFEMNDIITCTCGHCEWDGEHVLVRGFGLAQQGINGLLIPNGGFGPIDYDEPSQFRGSGEHLEIVQYSSASLALRLVERFLHRIEGPPQVGDEIIVVLGNAVGYRGKVIAKDPDPNHMNPHVVDLKWYRVGASLIEYFDRPWYPSSHKTDTRARTFVAANDVIIVNRDPV